MTTLETAPGLKGVGFSISPVLGKLSTPGFRRREALEECRRLSTRSYTKLHFLVSHITVSTVLSQKALWALFSDCCCCCDGHKVGEKIFEVGLTTVDGPTHADRA